MVHVVGGHEPVRGGHVALDPYLLPPSADQGLVSLLGCHGSFASIMCSLCIRIVGTDSVRRQTGCVRWRRLSYRVAGPGGCSARSAPWRCCGRASLCRYPSSRL